MKIKLFTRRLSVALLIFFAAVWLSLFACAAENAFEASAYGATADETPFEEHPNKKYEALYWTAGICVPATVAVAAIIMGKMKKQDL